MASATSDPRYLAGIEFFNQCEFFEAHEAWEELWKDYSGPSRNFYKGLIHVAVCLHHFGNENYRGAKKLYRSARDYLEPYRPFHQGIDLDKLIRELETCCAEMMANENERAKVEIVGDLIPEIHLETR
jgi:uncharacterized protein